MSLHIRNPAGKRYVHAYVRRPTLEDAPRIAVLAQSLPSLDRYAAYLYLLLSDHFATTCALAELEGLVVGFATGYRKPSFGDTLFVWQVGTAPAMHGKGIATHLLLDLLERPENQDIRYVETTVSPGNHASRRLFSGLAARLQAPLEELPGYAPVLFPGEHDPEPLLRIGPIARRSS